MPAPVTTRGFFWRTAFTVASDWSSATVAMPNGQTNLVATLTVGGGSATSANSNLAILNLMPIPVLDGGHMLIATIQCYTNNAIKASAVIVLQYTFMALLLGLMGYIILNDVRRCSGDSERQPAGFSGDSRFPY